MPSLKFISLHCDTPEDARVDEAFLAVDGRKVWGARSMRKGQTRDLRAVDPLPFAHRTRIRLYDEDGPDPHDRLGTVYAFASDAGSGQLEHVFRGDGARYTLYYEVLAEPPNRTETGSVTNPPPQCAPVDCTLSGPATIRTTYPDARGPFTEDVTIRMRFSGEERRSVRILEMSRITTADVTITKRATAAEGQFDRTSGNLSVPVDVNVNIHNVLARDATLHLDCVTRTTRSPDGSFSPTGSPVRDDGSVVLVAASEFTGGTLNGHDCEIVLPGRFEPNPKVC